VGIVIVKEAGANDAPREEAMGRVALVTGGTRGIGAACCKALKDAGYNVAANYGGNDDAANAFKKETGIPVFKWDVGDYLACEQGVIAVENEVGPVEVLVNNAGISRDAMLQKMTHEQWQEVIRTDLDSVFNMTRQVINGMRERGFGRVINISSINGQQGMLGLSNYCSAKAGMIGFTRAVALEGARKGITANAIAPGYVATELLANVSEKVMEAIVGQIPVGRLGEADEVARCVVFLAADASAWITGSTLTINGGQLMD
jgi:acetoacetyl-CoA reductase